MLLKGEYVAALIEGLVVAQSRFQIDALHNTRVSTRLLHARQRHAARQVAGASVMNQVLT